ncbi:O-antigen ligase family protein [Ectobacillus sp. sgz5001026]|uniref:O-antigen ligase family protein n=1 Tax=Ectobacillus sp. sgz5001026 TaxID=3242473 RepID=UPI0036D3B552
MLKNWDILESRFEIFLLLFIILQPILDLITSFGIIVLKTNATVGIFARFIVMILGILYIVLQARQKQGRNYLYYLAMLAAVLLIGLFINKMVKTPILFGEEIKYVAKTLYTFVMLGCYILLFQSWLRKGKQIDKAITYVVYATVLINIVMVLSIVTSTDFNSYEYFKTGSRGWFYAGNELGAVLAISFPAVLLFSVEKTKRTKDIVFWIPTLLSIFSLFAVGTKVGFGAILLGLGTVVVLCIIKSIFRKENRRVLLLNGGVAALLLAAVALYTPYSPIANNTKVHMKLIEEQNKKQAAEQNLSPDDLPKDQVGDLVFSGREIFLNMEKNQFKEAPSAQKLFGMGYGGNFKSEPKLIERDFHDLFYAFGYIGFFFILLPFVYYGVKIARTFVVKWRKLTTVPYALLVVGMALGLGIAYTAGHVLTAPGVSIYFVIIWAYLFVKADSEQG